tara:strand:+ start:93 stop:479 length:387 start_codon:yes stop_codon:yes gene_type:complete
MAFKMKAGKEGPMKKNYPSVFKKDDNVEYIDPGNFDRAKDYLKHTGKFLGGKLKNIPENLKKAAKKVRTGVTGALDKKLVGNQHNLPENLKDKIEASPMKNYKTPRDYEVFNMGNRASAPIKKKKKGY